jgi:hypothetical protein
MSRAEIELVAAAERHAQRAADEMREARRLLRRLPGWAQDQYLLASVIEESAEISMRVGILSRRMRRWLRRVGSS